MLIVEFADLEIGSAAEPARLDKGLMVAANRDPTARRYPPDARHAERPL
jgi:hypothetical protein